MSDMNERWANLRVEVADVTRDRHLAAITGALADTSSPARRRVAMAVAAAMALGAPATALAAEPSVPGDLLYPVKRVFEPIRGLVDNDIVAVHRLAELEVLLDRQTDPETLALALAETRRAVDRSGDPGHLSELDALEARIRNRAGMGEAGDGGVATPGSVSGATQAETDARDSGDRQEGRQSGAGGVEPSSTTEGAGMTGPGGPTPSTTPGTGERERSSTSSSTSMSGPRGSGGSESSPGTGQGSGQKP